MGAMPFTLTMAGAVQSDPASSSDATTLLSQSIDLASKETYDGSFGGNIPIAGNFTPALGAISKIRYVVIRAVDGESLVASVTWANGANQLIPISDVFLLKAKNAGDELTALSVSGIGRIEYIIAGNKT
jgi:hypothetical protein